MLAARRDLRQRDTGRAFKSRLQSLAPTSSTRNDRIELPQLRQRNRRLQFGHAIVAGKKRGITVDRAGRSVVAFVAGESQFSRELIVISNADPTVAAGD